VPCQECQVELAADSPDLRLNLTCDTQPLFYCVDCLGPSSAATADREVEILGLKTAGARHP
jgi:hypothetical protein